MRWKEKNLDVLHAVRKSFIEAESSEKIQGALRSNVRTYVDEKFVTGNAVSYRRQNCKGWCGPTKVLGKEGQYVLIRHGGAFYRMYPCHLMKANKEFGSPKNEGNKTTKIEINEVLGEEEGHYNKSLHINSEKLKDHRKKKKPSRGKVVAEYRTRSGKWKSSLY